MTRWRRAFWLESPSDLTEERGEGAVAFDDTDGPARWLPFPETERRAQAREETTR